MADTLDVLTLAEAHNAINLPNTVTAQDITLAMFVTAISRNLDTLVGPVVQRTISGETYDGTDDEDYERNSWSINDESFTRHGRPVGSPGPLLGRSSIYLTNRPVVSVTTVTEYSGTTATTLTEDTNTSHTGNAFAMNLKRGIITRRSGGRDWFFPTGRDNVVVTYVAGRYSSTATVDPRFKLAATMILSLIWPQQAGAWAQNDEPYGARPLIPPFAMFPQVAQDALWDQLQTGSPLGSG